MATFYIDPSLDTNGDGSLATPFNAWSSITLAAGNTYCQKRGTIAYLSSNLAMTGANGSATQHITLRDYGDTSLSVPKLVFSGGAFLNVTASRTYFDFLNLYFDTTGTTSNAVLLGSGVSNITFTSCSFAASSTAASLSLTGNSTSAVTNVTITDCDFISGSRGIQHLQTSVTAVTHSGFYVRNCRFYSGLTDGVRLSVETAASTTTSFNDVEISNCTFNGVQGGAVRLVAINLANSDTTSPTFWGNKLRIFKNTFRNCGLAFGNTLGTMATPFWNDLEIYENVMVNCSTAGALISGTHRKNGKIHDNILVNAVPVNGIDGSGVFADRFDNNMYIYRNKIRDNEGTRVVNSGEGIAVWMATNIYIHHNEIYNCKRGVSIGGNGTQASSNINVYNNTIFNIEDAGILFDADGTGLGSTAVNAYNNLIVNAAVGIDGAGAPQTNCNYNAFVSVTTTYKNSQAAGANDQVITSNDTALLNENCVPKTGSPLLAAGTYIAYGELPLNKQKPLRTPSIGANEVFTNRATR